MRTKLRVALTLCIASLALSVAKADNSECETATQVNRIVAKHSSGKTFSSEIERNPNARIQYNRMFEHLDAVRNIWKTGQPRPESGKGIHYPWRDECEEEKENLFPQAHRSAVGNHVRYIGLGNTTDLCRAEIEHEDSWNEADAQDKYQNSIGNYRIFSTVLLH